MKNNTIYLSVAILVAIAMGLLGYRLYARHSVAFQTIDELKGQGPEAVAGKTVVVDYEGFVYAPEKALALGTEFDSTYARHRPLTLTLGQTQVLPGLEKGLVGMKAGGRRRIMLPAALGYGSAGAGGGLVPPGASLLYVVEMRDVR